jgi:DNA polymerase-3 subunit delta'
MSRRFYRDRNNVFAVLELWREWWRDVLLTASGQPEIVTNAGLLDRAALMAGKYRIGDIVSFLRALGRTAEYLADNVNPQLALEVLMLQMPAPRKERQLAGPA